MRAKEPESPLRRGFYRFDHATSHLAGFLRLRRQLAAQGVSATQWVDGSFVESKLNPGDVDVVSYCDYDFINEFIATSGSDSLQLLNGRESTKPRFQTHTFLVLSCPPSHPYHSAFEEQRVYWRKWLGRTRNVSRPTRMLSLWHWVAWVRGRRSFPGHRKGFLQMALGSKPPTIQSA